MTRDEAIVLDYLGGEYNVSTIELFEDALGPLPELLRALAGLVEQGLIVALSDHTWELSDKGAEHFGGLREELRERRDRLALPL